MFGFRRTKRVTDPLDDSAKARIVEPDYVTLRADDDVTFPSFSDLFYGFEADAAADSSPESGDSDSDCSDRGPSTRGSADAELMIAPIVQNNSDAFRNLLAAHVHKAAQVFARAGSSGGGKSIARRNAMAYLRNCGYDAAVCETRWEGSGGLAAGNYEFIDVLRAGGARYFVDLDFAAEFEIARPTETYERLRRKLPAIFVGTGEDLKKILRSASDAARRSLRSGGLYLPPWRRHRFMQNKWLGPCRRTANVFPAAFSNAPSPAKRSHGVKCRAVGFDAAVYGGGLLFPTTARTR